MVTNPAGHTVSDSGEIRVDDDGRLMIDSVKMEHAGNYSCAAETSPAKLKRPWDSSC
jgi:hypothetical protein